MPFTISHAAVVLPFSRALARRRLLSAAIIGSMVPDFGLFAPWRMGRIETHSAMGLLTFCLPIGLATYWIFQYLIKPPLLELLPDGAYTRWRPFASPADLGSLRQWILAASGVLAGAVTHLVWDGFTHEGARGVRMIPALDDPVVEFGGHHMLGVRLLQDVSSLIGLAVVLGMIWYILRKGREQPSTPRILPAAERRAWALAYAVTAVMLSGVCLLLTRFPAHYAHSVTGYIGSVAIASLRGLAAALVGVSVCLTIRLRARTA